MNNKYNIYSFFNNPRKLKNFKVFQNLILLLSSIPKFSTMYGKLKILI